MRVDVLRGRQKTLVGGTFGFLLDAPFIPRPALQSPEPERSASPVVLLTRRTRAARNRPHTPIATATRPPVMLAAIQIVE